MAAVPAGMDQHELLSILAPRPFLLIGGDKFEAGITSMLRGMARDGGSAISLRSR